MGRVVRSLNFCFVACMLLFFPDRMFRSRKRTRRSDANDFVPHCAAGQVILKGNQLKDASPGTGKNRRRSNSIQNSEKCLESLLRTKKRRVDSNQSYKTSGRSVNLASEHTLRANPFAYTGGEEECMVFDDGHKRAWHRDPREALSDCPIDSSYQAGISESQNGLYSESKIVGLGRSHEDLEDVDAESPFYSVQRSPFRKRCFGGSELSDVMGVGPDLSVGCREEGEFRQFGQRLRPISREAVVDISVSFRFPAVNFEYFTTSDENYHPSDSYFCTEKGFRKMSPHNPRSKKSLLSFSEDLSDHSSSPCLIEELDSIVPSNEIASMLSFLFFALQLLFSVSWSLF